MRISILTVLFIFSGALIGQTHTRLRQQAQSGPGKLQSPPQKDEITSAREATDKFLSGLKIAELPEGKQLMLDAQWVAGYPDYGKSFYSRPQFIESTTLYEGLFDTDIPGVHGYKRLLEMKEVSEAGTPILARYCMYAFKDASSGNWKVLETDDGLDLEESLAYFAKRSPLQSDLDHSFAYGFWLLLAGRTKEARETLTEGLSAQQNNGALGGGDPSRTVLQIKALLSVIDAISGNESRP